MALRDYTQPSRTLTIPGGDFTVKGLSFNVLAGLFTDAKDEMMEAMGMYDGMASSGEVTNEALGLALVKQFPKLVAKVIAYAADEPESEEQAAKLPLPIQLDALVTISDLTFSEPDALKKFIGQVMSLIQKAKTLAP